MNFRSDSYGSGSPYEPACRETNARLCPPLQPQRALARRDMLFKTRSAAVYGIDANLIDVEVDFSHVAQKEETFSVVGLPDAAVRESRDRVRSAVKNSGFDLPPTRITI